MKLRLASLSLLVLTLATVPAMAQTLYSNGPTNGNTDAWTIDLGAIVSNTFNLANNDTNITGGSFAMWLYSGETLTSAELSITSGENSGTSYFDQTVNFTQGSCTGNQYGYNVCQENTTFNGPTLNAGTYWLNLQNASVPFGFPVYWDENSGPSQAIQCCNKTESVTNAVGSIPSEAFTLLGQTTTSTFRAGADSQASSSVPEPASIMMFGSGILGFAGLLRRKLF
jgi:hypothetical protein